MTDQELVAFTTLIVVAGGVWVTLFYLLPKIARAKFQYRATVLRDECLDTVFDGRLRWTTPVESFLARANAMATHPEAFTLTKAMAVHRAITCQECDEPTPPSYASLKPEERKLLHEFDDRLHQALGERLVRGSSFGWLLWLPHALGLVSYSKRGPNVISTTPSPKHLAWEYGAVAKPEPIEGHKLASLA